MAGAGVGTGAVVSIIGALVSTAISVGIQLLTAPNVKGPRQKESGFQASDYGRPIALCWGPSNRVTGTVIFYSGLQEHARKRSGSGGSTTTFTYSCTAAVALGEGKLGSGVNRVWANKKIILEEEQFTMMEDFTYYDGAADQLPDATLETYLGIGNVPAYRHTCYAVVKNIELADLGPTLPQFEFEWIADVSTSVDVVVLDIGSRAGVTIDVSMLDGNVGQLDGYLVDQEISAADALIPLAVAYNFDVAERGGALVCVPRGMGAVATIYMRDAGAVSGSEISKSIIENSRVPESELPQEVSITYRDLFRDYQQSTQRATRNLGSARANVTLDIPLTLDADQARRLAHRVLWGMVTSRRSARLRVSPRWIGVLPADVFNLEVPTGALLPYRLMTSTLGANNVLEWEVQAEDAEIYNCSVPAGGDIPTVPGDTGGAGPDGAPGATTLVLIDAPIFRDAHDNAGFYAVGAGNTANWRGYVLHRSTDGGTDYEPITEGMEGGTIGAVATALPSGTTDVWDRANSLSVVINIGGSELESRSELSVLNGLNVAWIGPESGVGGEIIQFATATLTGTRTYTLSNLLRGRRGTEWAVGSHGADEIFVLLDDSGFLLRKDFGAADLNLARLYKPVSVLTAIDDTTAQSFTNGGEGKRPWSPARLVGRWNGNLDLTVRWHRRTRLFTSGIGGVAALGEEDETYQLDIYEPADVWVLGSSYSIGDVRRYQSAHDYGWRYYRARTNHTATVNNRPDQISANWATRWAEVQPVRAISLADRTTYVYTSNAQIADGQTPGGAFHLQCRQRSAVVGFGHPAFSVC